MSSIEDNQGPETDSFSRFRLNRPGRICGRRGSTPNGGKFYIFDSCVIRDPEERAAIDRRVADVFVQAERRKFLAALEAEEQAAQAAGEG